MFEEKSFALIFILLLGVPALPLPRSNSEPVDVGRASYEG
jgi:hypothetical protein